MEVMRCKILQAFHIKLSQIGIFHHQNCPATLTEIFQPELKKKNKPFPLFNTLILGHRLNHKHDLHVRHFFLLVIYT